MLSDGKEKAEVILAVTLAWGYDTIVETGTSSGETIGYVAVMANPPKLEIFTLEIDHAKYLNAVEHLWALGVMPICANSAIHLPRLLDYLGCPCVLFLDAHDTDVNSPTPIRSELDHIFYRSDQRHVVIIDDANLFGTGQWPSTQELADYANQNHYSYTLDSAENLIYLAPQ